MSRVSSLLLASFFDFWSIRPTIMCVEQRTQCVVCGIHNGDPAQAAHIRDGFLTSPGDFLSTPIDTALVAA